MKYKDCIKAKELIEPVLLFIPSSVIMYSVVRIIGNHMGPGILTNIIQGILGAFIYFIITELNYGILKKQSIITYIKNILKIKES